MCAFYVRRGKDASIILRFCTEVEFVFVAWSLMRYVNEIIRINLNYKQYQHVGINSDAARTVGHCDYICAKTKKKEGRKNRDHKKLPIEKESYYTRIKNRVNMKTSCLFYILYKEGDRGIRVVISHRSSPIVFSPD